MKKLGDDHPSVGTSYYNIAEVFFYQGKYVKSSQQLITALKVFKEKLGDDHLTTKNVLTGLFM
jgi:hypothetical protein